MAAASVPIEMRHHRVVGNMIKSIFVIFTSEKTVRCNDHCVMKKMDSMRCYQSHLTCVLSQIETKIVARLITHREDDWTLQNTNRSRIIKCQILEKSDTCVFITLNRYFSNLIHSTLEISECDFIQWHFNAKRLNLKIKKWKSKISMWWYPPSCERSINELKTVFSQKLMEIFSNMHIETWIMELTEMDICLRMSMGRCTRPIERIKKKRFVYF